MIRKHITFSGWVQGVRFRYRARHAADLYGCTGCVRNEWDWANPAGYSSSASGTAAGPLADARAAINSGDLSRAEMILGSIVDRNAEWNFLMGMLCFRRGWMDDASRYFRVSATMDPTNPEYRQAVSYMETVGRQPRTTVVRSSDPDYCSICTNLMVADCCCEMMGGDLIRCI